MPQSEDGGSSFSHNSLVWGIVVLLQIVVLKKWPSSRTASALLSAPRHGGQSRSFICLITALIDVIDKEIKRNYHEIASIFAEIRLEITSQSIS
jgi:hypothetical protein